MTFSEKLVKLRKLKGLTQDEFASAIGVSRQAVYKWECGQSYPEVPKLIEMKKLFGISLDDLLDESYEVVLPEKPKRKRTPKAPTEKTVETTTETPTEAAEVVEEAVVVEETPVTEAPIVEATEEAPVVEEAATEETPAQEEATEEPKKKGFFARLFGLK